MAQMFRILGKRGRITIPFEIRQRVGFSYNDVLSFTEAPDGRTVIVKREKICDNCAAEKPQRKEAEDTIICNTAGSSHRYSRTLRYTIFRWAKTLLWRMSIISNA